MIAVAFGSDLNSMTYLGLMGLMDPPRNGVPEAIKVLNDSGVSVKMLTGDSRETAVSIGNVAKCLKNNGAIIKRIHKDSSLVVDLIF